MIPSKMDSLMSETDNCADDYIVSLDRISKTFLTGIRVLQEVSASIRRGEVVAIAGPSGSGKSTLLRCLNGLESIDGGTIIIDGIQLTDSRKSRTRIRKRIGMGFELFNLFPNMTVLENINLAQRLTYGKSKKEATDTTMALLEKIGIDKKNNCYPSELSGGQQQWVTIARALALAPKIMLFDDACSVLAPEIIREVPNVMKSLAGDAMTMIVATHEMGFARKVSDRMIFMEGGRIIGEGPTEEFFNEPGKNGCSNSRAGCCNDHTRFIESDTFQDPGRFLRKTMRW